MASELIRVAQLPVIEEQLRSAKGEVEALVRESMSLACTVDTVREVKRRRAELNKQFASLEEQRKAVKAAVLGPYQCFEAVYRDCISGPFQRADADLKMKIVEVEQDLRGRCEDRLRAYFDELRQVHNVPDWLVFDRAGLKIDLTSAKQAQPRKLMDQLNQFVAGVACDLDSIGKLDDGPEVLVEYQQTLNLSQAITAVQDRKRAVEEAQRQAVEREAAEQLVQQAVERVEKAAQPPVAAKAVEPVEKIYRCVFTVRATKQKLIALREFMRVEGIQYG